MPSISRYYSSTAAKTTLADAIDSSSASLQLAAASGLPSQYPFTLILEKDTANEEIVEVTGLVGSAYIITRNIDGSGAKSHSIGALVEHGVSARDFSDSRSHEAATSAHGVTGDVVGTGGAQTITGVKTFSTAPVISGATISGTFTSTATISGGTLSGNTITSGTLGNALNAGGYKITNLATPTASSDAVRKDFADAQVTAAATSAASAAVSASSAATSATSAANSVAAIASYATSAANSASAAATSATSAATSASSALASQTAAATSATSAAASATAAATSATSAAASATAAATSAASALTSQTAAATSATSAAASATAANSSAVTAAASVAAIAAYASAAATSEANALTSANSAATSAASAAASTSAAAASASDAATSATSAATSATSAAASALAASTSATSASASATLANDWATYMAGPVAGGEYSAKYNAGLAATSATSAATSATSADNSATAAATSAASAATSATSAATTYDNFDDRYLGSKSSPPSVDNDGNPLLVGAIYWNSTLNNMYVWSGSAWVQIATTSVYSAPTLGSTTIDSGTTYTTIVGLTLDGGLATADPTVNLGLATKQYVDNAIEGLHWKSAVNLRADSNVSLTGTAGTLIIDGHDALVAADTGYRILLNGQSTASENGIYTYSDNGSTYTLARSSDADDYLELEGAAVYVLEGTVYGGTAWVQTEYTLTSFSGQVWNQFGASTEYSAGYGLNLAGTTFSILNSYTDEIKINAVMGVF